MRSLSRRRHTCVTVASRGPVDVVCPADAGRRRAVRRSGRSAVRGRRSAVRGIRSTVEEGERAPGSGGGRVGGPRPRLGRRRSGGSVAEGDAHRLPARRPWRGAVRLCVVVEDVPAVAVVDQNVGLVLTRLAARRPRLPPVEVGRPRHDVAERDAVRGAGEVDLARVNVGDRVAVGERVPALCRPVRGVGLRVVAGAVLALAARLRDAEVDGAAA
eukprot:CAMPEP_0184105056 /NCGR_PEP_ID=MMETSP0974-20121125/14678_1 /TAXON_ID=483370 /ORGANISM="non described non described, Strain CCMP2097" /LENGTH=214 /DNA_ID=CAMNT_0026408057 /DNA_START=1 /DNA_END=645 /DNA_ORIENTATION=-